MTSETGALPLYQQISEMLIRDIAAGRLLDGERLPPEREMAAQLGIAIGTLRRALAELTEKGFLERIQGSGNYVRAQSGAESVYAFFRLELAEGGGLPTAQVLSVDRLGKPATCPRSAPGPGRTASGGCASCPGSPPRSRRSGSTAAMCARAYGRRAVGVALSLLSHPARPVDRAGRGSGGRAAGARLGAPRFPRQPGALVGHVVRISWAQDGARAEVSRTWFDDHAVRYVARLKIG
jgi:GntR family transcriptional regulator